MIRFNGLTQIDFPYLLSMVHNSFTSSMNTLVVPGGKLGLAMELIMTPLVKKLVTNKKSSIK